MLTIYDSCFCGSRKALKDCCYDLVKARTEEDFARLSVKWPVKECWIIKDCQEIGKTTAMIIKTMPNGKIFMVGFLLDLWCLGVKDAYVGINADEETIKKLLEEMSKAGPGIESISYEDARSMVFGCLKYAESIGFAPHAEWSKIKYAIEPERSFVDKFKFGYVDGKPFYAQGPFDEQELDVKKIKKHVLTLGGRWDVNLEEDYEEPMR